MHPARPPTTASQSGFALFPGAFVGDDLIALRDATDSALRRVLAAARTADAEKTTTVWPDGHRLQDIDGTTIHWEPDAADTVRSLSPVAHLDARLDALWADRRLIQPACEVLGVNDVAPVKSGLNVKKAGVGSEYRWHQDVVPNPKVANVMIFLDDAMYDNGPLCLLPGSHLAGLLPVDPADPIGQHPDPSLIDDRGAVTIIAEAGTAVAFVAILLHRSSPNRSSHDRLALRYSFQSADGDAVRPDSASRGAER